MSLMDYILGDDAASGEFVVRRASPRFIARVVSDLLGEACDPDGLSVRLDADQALADFQWIDQMPDTATLLAIADEVLAFLLHREEVEERELEEYDDG